MDVLLAPEPPVNWQGLLGYLNFSDGRPDVRFQQQLHAAYQVVGAAADPVAALAELFDREVKTLQSSGSAAFRDISQAESVIRIVLREFPQGYLAHHADLLGHQTAAQLYSAFFLARVFEATLQHRHHGGANGSMEKILDSVYQRLDDYVGYRPVPVLETRASIDFYAKEKLRPIPLFIKGVGVAAGPYRDVVLEALKILQQTPGDLLDDAQFEFDVLEELAFDPRAYDHNHPANRRPNYVFGEWDPHHLDSKGRFSRFVLRQTILDLLMRRIAASRTLQFKLDPTTKNYVAHFSVPWDDSGPTRESSAVLAGTTLMASMLCGQTPTSHDSTVTLSTLVPQIAKLRDEFYDRLLKSWDGELAETLRADAEKTRQPFGGVRQSLNQALAQDRAAHLQERQLAVLFAVIGFPEEARARARQVAAPGVRFVIEARIRLTEAVVACQNGELAKALELVEETADVVKRGIDCGALVDPWNILGYQGLYPLFQSREDSVHDPRVEELLQIVGDMFDGYATIVIDAAARGELSLRANTLKAMQDFSEWWDRFAAYEVSDVQRVHGGEAVESADHVATALALWRQASGKEGFTGPAASVAFWREHLEGFKTPAAFARVVSALLDRNDLPASMSLLMTWLSQTPSVPLGDGDLNFRTLALRWLKLSQKSADAERLTARFFELLEANADEFWQVPSLEFSRRTDGDEAEDTFEAAYEGMTFRDSADDGTEGALVGDELESEPFSLDEHADRIRERIKFLTTVAELIREAGESRVSSARSNQAWARLAIERAGELEGLLDPLNDVELPAPDTGSFESSVEYDRRRDLKESLLEETIAAVLAFRQAARSFGPQRGKLVGAFPWEGPAAALDQQIRHGDLDAVRQRLRDFLKTFREEPLLYVPVGAGGHPRQVMRARAAQGMLHSLLDRLPRLGLLRESFQLTQLARKMEQNSPPEGRRVTEFDRLFPVGLRHSVETLLDAIEASEPEPDGQQVLELLNALSGPYLKLWLKHSKSLRLSILETVQSSAEWLQIEQFVHKYGRELFTAHVLNLANLKAIIHRGIEDWIDQLEKQDQPPERFFSDLDRTLSRTQAIRFLEIVLQAIMENYDEYRDYNTTTTQSDYGNNLFMLLDLLRLKSNYERDNWLLKPMLLTHEVLCRRNRTADAGRWQELTAVYTRHQSDTHLQELARLEAKHAMKLRTVRERLEERFVAGLEQDRLAARLQPLWKSAKQRTKDSNSLLTGFKEALLPFTKNPVGAGLETPGWIRRLEREMARIKTAESSTQATTTRPISLPALRKQLTGDWEERDEAP